MDFKEMLRSVSQSAGRAWERVRYLSRANRILAISLFLVLSVGLIIWARAGFTLDFGRLFAGTVFTSPTVALRAEVRDRLDSGGVEYNLVWATNTDNFYALYGIDVECLPEASPGDKNNIFYADIKSKGFDHGTLKDSNLPGGGWYYITSGLGIVRVELGLLQTPVSFRIVCRASSTQAQGVRLDSATWYSNTICLPSERVISELPPGTTPDPNRCQEKSGGIGVPPPLARASTTTTGGTTTGGTTTGGTTTGGTTTGGTGSGGTGTGSTTGGPTRKTPVAGTAAKCEGDTGSVKGTCRAAADSGEVEVAGTDCAAPMKCFAKKHAPWSYCDYATYSCKVAPDTLFDKGITEDWSAPQCGATNCIPGQCRVRSGNGPKLADWLPAESPEGLPVCEPLSEISEALFPGFGKQFYREGGGSTPGNVTPTIAKPPPVDFPNCLYLEDGYGSSDPNLGTMTGNTVPQVLRDRPNARLIYSAFVVNNCPWEVHLVANVDGSPKASQDTGTGSRGEIPEAQASALLVDNTADGHDFPSCWNNNKNMTPVSCGKLISWELKLNAFTCGSVGILIDWWHRIQNNGSGGGNARSDTYCDQEGRCSDVGKTGRGTGWRSVLNYGKDCTGAVTERSPTGPVKPTTSTAPNTCKTTLVPAPANLTVKCGTTSNVLTWNTATNACEVGILRGDNTTSLVFVSPVPTFPATTYTDTKVQAGHTYTYVVKNHPSIRSNPVTCKDGVQVTTSPTPTTSTATPRPSTPIPGTSTPVPTTPRPVTPVPTVVITPPLPGNQLQCAPLAQTVTLNQKAFVQAFGGTGSYSITTTSDGTISQVAQDRSSIQFATPGGRLVTVADGQTSVQCTVNVSAPGTPDIDDEDGDGIPDTTECPSFPCADTDRDGTPDYLDTDSDNDGIPDSTDSNRTVRNVVGSPGQVQTGPGETTLLALVVSALVSLLYVSYAHSPLYRRHEAKKVAEDQAPMDFRL